MASFGEVNKKLKALVKKEVKWWEERVLVIEEIFVIEF